MLAAVWNNQTCQPGLGLLNRCWEVLAAILKQPNLSGRMGVKSLLGGADGSLEQSNLSAKIGVIKSLLGGAGGILKQPNLSARIGAKSLLGGAGGSLEQPNLLARIGVKSLLGVVDGNLEATKPVSQDWGY